MAASRNLNKNNPFVRLREDGGEQDDDDEMINPFESVQAGSQARTQSTRSPWRTSSSSTTTTSMPMSTPNAPTAAPQPQPKKKSRFAAWKSKTKGFLVLACAAVLVPLALMWILQILHSTVMPNLVEYGILPRTLIGLRGLVLAPFIHASWGHILTNTTGWLFLGFPIAMRGVSLFITVSLVIMFCSGLFVWCVGKVAYHVGCSGIIFGFFGFIVTSACCERPLNWMAILSAVITVTAYGGIIFGLVPLFTPANVSWEYHVGGALAGIAFAASYAGWKARQHRLEQAKMPGLSDA